MRGQTEAGLKEAAGSLELDKCTVKRLDGKLKDKSALVISSSVKGEYLLLHEAEAEIDSWVKLLIEKGSRLSLSLSLAPSLLPSRVCVDLRRQEAPRSTEKRRRAAAKRRACAITLAYQSSSSWPRRRASPPTASPSSCASAPSTFAPTVRAAQRQCCSPS
jgi:hypothetical protein